MTKVVCRKKTISHCCPFKYVSKEYIFFLLNYSVDILVRTRMVTKLRRWPRRTRKTLCWSRRRREEATTCMVRTFGHSSPRWRIRRSEAGTCLFPKWFSSLVISTPLFHVLIFEVYPDGPDAPSHLLQLHHPPRQRDGDRHLSQWARHLRHIRRVGAVLSPRLPCQYWKVLQRFVKHFLDVPPNIHSH